MNQLAIDTQWSVIERSDTAVSSFVDRILQLTQPACRHERRKDKRVAFPHLLTLTPIKASSIVVDGEPVSVAGRYLAGRGIDFHHAFPLPFKRAIVSFEEGLGLDDAHFVLNISWCRFLRPGWYDSGGRFTHIVTTNPVEFGGMGSAEAIGKNSGNFHAN